jgi:tetratricopeptide (TPR) repeat protein
MTTLDEVLPLIERGHYEEAMRRIEELDDPFDKIEALSKMVLKIYREQGPVDWIPELIDDAVYITRKMGSPGDRVMGYSMIASTLALLGYETDSADFFNAAIAEADKVEDPLSKGVALAALAYYLAVSGYPEQALETFNTAFDTIINAEIAYRIKVDGLIRVADLLEQAGDVLPSKDALEFYRNAFDIFDKLNVNQRAALVEKKIELAKTVYDVGLPQIRKALLEGRNRYALAILERKYSGVARLIGSLEIALWMKRVNNPEYLDVVERAFETCNEPHFTEANVQRIARLLTELGSFKRALKFALEIRDLRKRSEAMKAIALELASMDEYEEAMKITERIPDPAVRNETLLEIAAMRGT